RIKMFRSRRRTAWTWLVRSLVAGAVAVLPGAGVCTAQERPVIGVSDGELAASLPGATLQVFTYRPAKCSPSLLLMVFHGTERNAGPYRDHARPLADKLCAIVVAPKFDKGRFPKGSYQYGGVADHGRVTPVGSRPVD